MHVFPNMWEKVFSIYTNIIENYTRWTKPEMVAQMIDGCN